MKDFEFSLMLRDHNFSSTVPLGDIDDAIISKVLDVIEEQLQQTDPKILELLEMTMANGMTLRPDGEIAVKVTHINDEKFIADVRILDVNIATMIEIGVHLYTRLYEEITE